MTRRPVRSLGMRLASLATAALFLWMGGGHPAKPAPIKPNKFVPAVNLDELYDQETAKESAKRWEFRGHWKAGKDYAQWLDDIHGDESTLHRFASPDGRYVAAVVIGEAEVNYLAVFAKEPSGGSSSLPSFKLMMTVSDVTALVWEPDAGHRLWFSCSGIYGDPIIGLWEGGEHYRVLRRLPDNDKAAYMFVLLSVRADGREARYKYIVMPLTSKHETYHYGVLRLSHV
ncbi:MAG TPA: hypothetical protein VKV18_06360 [Chthonomonas sp.]|uniref:hypothetical protein n=1 Tax=Chthonomonas sp. TaxID=2282153 RepID=UPI002B4AD8E8|nr:hypothetical protein [Chthonomonas sp.]HLI48293.1 hypothetical protein [Chthonomonas sp.]